MKVRVLLFRILPIVCISGFSLLSFQNCSKNTSLTGEGQNVAGGTGSGNVSNNPSSGTADNIYTPVQVPGDNGGGSAPGLSEPECIKVQVVNDEKAQPVGSQLLVNITIIQKLGKSKLALKPTYKSFPYSEALLKLEMFSGNPEPITISLPKEQLTASFSISRSDYTNVKSISGHFSSGIFDQLPLFLCPSDY